MYDVIIIGAGASGAAIARELSRYQGRFCVLEKEADICCGTSKANSGIVHAGFDAKEGSLMAKLNVKGNKMMENLSKEARKNVPISTRIIENSIVVSARYTIICGTRRSNKRTSLRPLKIASPARSKTTIVVTFTPPPVEPGPAPINISQIVKSCVLLNIVP